MDLNLPVPYGEPRRDPDGTDDGPRAMVELVAGDFLLTVNPVDGSEIVSCPPGRRPLAPRRAPGGADPAPAHEGPLLEREEERHRLYRLLARGRSVRLVGPAGSGRSTLLAAVARDCADLAPYGVIRLSGYRRGPKDLLHELYAAVHHTPGYRPGPTELVAELRGVGAVVVIDDIEFGGTALGEILEATPECAFLISARPGVPAPTEPSDVREITLGGLSRTASLELLELAVARPLTEAEASWAGDLWHHAEGLPQRFVQAAALLRRRAGADSDAELPDPTGLVLALAESLREGAREILRLAVALGDVVPGPDRLVGLVADPAMAEHHADLVASGLLSPVGDRHRLTSAALAELLGADYADGAEARSLAAAQHYAAWFGRRGVNAAEAAAEAEVLPSVIQAAQRAGHAAAVADLARVAAPVLAASLRWNVWERVLRSGAESARGAGAVAQQAYFHHELGVLAICQGRLDRARAELEAATALRGVLSDARGAVAGRRALALVEDLSRPLALPPGSQDLTQPLALPPAATTTRLPAVADPAAPAGDRATTRLTRVDPEPPAAPTRRRSRGARRNVVVAGATAALAAVLGTVVAFGLSSDGDSPDDGGRPDPAPTDDDLPLTTDADPTDEPTDETPSPTETEPPAEPSADPTLPTEDAPTYDPTYQPDDPTTGGGTATGGSGGGDTTDPTDGSSGGNEGQPTDPPTEEPTDDPPTEEPTDDPTTEEPTEEPTTPGDDGDGDSDGTTAAGTISPTATPTATPTA
ncbi:ATP-binding protein [Streptomyces hainanensis]|uniref:ATP-binding protein n=1 Tax=Streptomyces hainanensis TaxID=402648 RepID=A0A4R4TI05_9ACTN|nr:ATP-binding protein [Streptomyces hainanensis]TDC77408.1 ATP-binding protein [Streptomyces hainanensis]